MRKKTRPPARCVPSFSDVRVGHRYSSPLDHAVSVASREGGLDPHAVFRAVKAKSQTQAAGGGISGRLSDYIERMCLVDGAPFQFEGQEFIRPLMDVNDQYPEGSRNQVWATSRQVGKSTTQAAVIASRCAVYPQNSALYVAPRGEQVSMFSNQRFRPMCEESPAFSPWIDPANNLWQVKSRMFSNGSKINFKSCYLDADGIRGITARILAIDEIQDILSDAIPVIESVQVRFPEDRVRLYAGTHKTTSNGLNRRYVHSSQFEWIVPCRNGSCKFENYLDESVIAEDAYRCARCSEELVMTDGRWTPLAPEYLDKCWGFRVTQIMVPFLRHKDVKAVRDDPQVSRQKYYNETLGLPYDEGTLCLTRKNMQDACGDTGMWRLDQIAEMAARGVPLFGGVDYGTGLGTNPSWTVLCIGHYGSDEKFHVLYLHRCTGGESDLNSQPALIDSIFSRAGVRWACFDWGFGADKNARLCSEFGWNRYGQNRLLMEVMYTRQGLEAKWDSTGERYHVDRSKSMGLLIDHIREGRVVFPNVESMEPYIEDFTTIFMEYNDTKNTTRYDHDLPDDTFHAVNYAYMAARQFYGKFVATSAPTLPPA